MDTIKRIAGVTVVASLLALTACGGGGGGSNGGPPPPPPPPPPPVNTTLSGTAASGAPVIGQVTVRDALGNTRSELIAADGSYSIDVNGMTAPFRLRAEGTVGGRTVRLHSYADTADQGGTVNITPFTDLIVANAAQQLAASFFDSQTDTTLDPVVLDEQETALQAKLQDVFDALGVGTAIDLLHETFSADHSGLDAALDAITIETDVATNVATITVLSNTANAASIQDNLLDTTDNTDVLAVTNAGALTSAVSDTQAIAAAVDSFIQNFASGLPTAAQVQDYIAADFYNEDKPKSVFLTEITSDPSLVGITISSLTVSDLDSALGTATISFHLGKGGFVDPTPDTWYVVKDPTLGWQLRGDGRIAETYFDFHCNDDDGTDSIPGGCGINTQFRDSDFTNNQTAGNAPIASGTVSILDGSNTATVKAVIYLGTPAYAAPGDVEIYGEGAQAYQGDWKAFGTGTGELDPSIFQAGDIVEYKLYTEALDITNPAAPAIAAAAVPVATYQDTLLHAPATSGAYPAADSATIAAITGFTPGSGLSLNWTYAAGTFSDEVLVRLSDAQGNNLEVWDSSFPPDATGTSIASTQLDSAAAGNAGLDPNATSYTLLVRIYALDFLTGQLHSTDYSASVPGPAAGGGGGGGGGGGSTFVCSYESGWDDLADGGLGRPITPNSFADYEAVIADCGTAQTFTAADVAGNTFREVGTADAMTFNQGVGTQASPATGVYDDGQGFTANFEWYVETATCVGCNYNYLVVYTDTTIDPNLPMAWLRQTNALIGTVGTPGSPGSQYSYVKYSEQSNFSDTSRASGADGEIWNSTDEIL